MQIEELTDELSGDVVVDALLGTGLKAALREPFAQAVEVINRSPAKVMAIDIPTGVDADTGGGSPRGARGRDVHLHHRKLGLFTGPGVAYRGDLIFDDLGVPAATALFPAASAELRCVAPLGFRAAEAGCERMPSNTRADRYSWSAAITTWAARRHGRRNGAARGRRHGERHHARRTSTGDSRSQAGDHGCRLGGCTAPVAELLEKASVLIVGPGLGRTDWGLALLREVMNRTDKPTVLDADGLHGCTRDCRCARAGR